MNDHCLSPCCCFRTSLGISTIMRRSRPTHVSLQRLWLTINPMLVLSQLNFLAMCAYGEPPAASILIKITSSHVRRWLGLFSPPRCPFAGQILVIGRPPPSSGAEHQLPDRFCPVCSPRPVRLPPGAEEILSTRSPEPSPPHCRFRSAPPRARSRSRPVPPPKAEPVPRLPSGFAAGTCGDVPQWLHFRSVACSPCDAPSTINTVRSFSTDRPVPWLESDRLMVCIWCTTPVHLVHTMLKFRNFEEIGV